jgi:phage gp45-like
MKTNLKYKEDVISIDKPTVINVRGGVQIYIDEENNIEIYGHKSLNFKVDGDINFDGKNINLRASESYNLNVDGDIYVGSSTHIVEQAPRIDLNPEIMTSGYKNK